MSRFVRATIVFMTLFAMSGSIAAHVTHALHLNKHAKTVADVSEVCSLCAKPTSPIAKYSFELPVPEFSRLPLLAIDIVPAINSEEFGTLASRAPPRFS